MPAALCREGNGHRALWTLFRCRRCSRRGLLRPAIHLLNHKKHAERHDEKVYDGIQEKAVIECGRTRGLRRCQTELPAEGGTRFADIDPLDIDLMKRRLETRGTRRTPQSWNVALQHPA